MKIGDEEWFKGLESRVAFPAKIAFYFDKKRKTITSRVVESKAKINNVRYVDLKPSALAFQSVKDSAIVAIEEYNNSNEYYNALLNVRTEWKDLIDDGN